MKMWTCTSCIYTQCKYPTRVLKPGMECQTACYAVPRKVLTGRQDDSLVLEQAVPDLAARLRLTLALHRDAHDVGTSVRAALDLQAGKCENPLF